VDRGPGETSPCERQVAKCHVSRCALAVVGKKGREPGRSERVNGLLPRSKVWKDDLRQADKIIVPSGGGVYQCLSVSIE
jgi:hypothetical protein